MLLLALVLIFLVAFGAATAVLVLGKNYFTGHPETATPEIEVSYDSIFSLDRTLLLKEETLSTISFWDRLLARMNGIEIVKRHLAESGSDWSVGRLTLAMLLAGAASWAILHRISWIPEIGALIAGLAAGVSPYLMIMRRRTKLLLEFEQQFPDSMDTLARALRAGNSLAGGLELLAREGRPPVSTEIRKTVDERNLGLSWEQALDNLAVRVPIQEVRIFAASIQLQSRTGGRLHEVLARLAENMRESAALKGEIRAIAAHGRTTGLILTVLPVAIASMMMIVNPTHMAVLWNHPSGKNMILAAVGCLVAAHFVIRKLVDIKI
ncbi:MAG: hypothetical protein FJW20_24090 [Acidimicrobiia bacterium]|nr:hypothetical protein [Acidimicrobiia bacterium]